MTYSPVIGAVEHSNPEVRALPMRIRRPSVNASTPDNRGRSPTPPPVNPLPPPSATTLATMTPAAFLPLPPVFSSRPPLPTRAAACRTHRAPAMVSSTVVGVSLVTITAGGLGAAFFLLRNNGAADSAGAAGAAAATSGGKPTATDAGADAGAVELPIDVNPLKEITAILEPPEQPEAPAEPQVVVIPQGGIIGLGAPVADPSAVGVQEPAEVQLLPNLDSVGVDLNRYIPEEVDDTPMLTKPMEVELAWAAGALCALPGYGGIVVADKNGKVRYADGTLLKESANIGFSVRGFASGEDEIMVVDANALSFLKQGAVCAAIVPIGKEGAVMVIASSERDFLGEKETRTAESVRTRLEYAFTATEIVAADG